MSTDNDAPTSTRTAPSTRRKGRARRVAKRLWWWLLVPLLLLAAVAWWWLQSSRSLHSALELAQEAVPGLEITGASGSVLGGGHIDTLRWSDESTALLARDITFKWDAAALRKNSTLRISSLNIESLEVRSASDPKRAPKIYAPPASLSIPIAIEADAFALKRFAYFETTLGDGTLNHFNTDTNTDTNTSTPALFAIHNIRGNYHYNHSHHTAHIQHAHYHTPHEAPAQADFTATLKDVKAQLAATAPFPLELDAELHTALYDQASPPKSQIADTQPSRRIALAAQHTLHGTGELAHPTVAFNSTQLPSPAHTAPGTTADGTVQLLPLAPQLVKQAQLTLHDVNPRDFHSDSPRALLNIDLTIAPPNDHTPEQPFNALTGNIRIDNSETGLLEAEQLPVMQIRGALNWERNTPQRLTARNLHIALLSGHATGTAFVDAATQSNEATKKNTIDWGADIELHGINPNALTAFAPQAELHGSAQLDPATENNALLDAALNLRNAKTGSWDTQHLPVQNIQTDLRVFNNRISAKNIRAQVAGGSVKGDFETRIAAPYTWLGALQVAGVNPAQIYSTLPAAQLHGNLRASNQCPPTSDCVAGNQTATTYFSSALRGKVDSKNFAPSNKKQILSALNFDALNVEGDISTVTTGVGKSNGQRVRLRNIDIRALQTSIQGAATIDTHTNAFSTQQLTIQAPGLTAKLTGDIAEQSGNGTVELDWQDARKSQQWMQTLFSTAAKAPDALAILYKGTLRGKAKLDAQWQGGWRNPNIKGALRSPKLRMDDNKGAAPQWALSNLTLDINGTLAQSTLKGDTQFQIQEQKGKVQLAGKAGYTTENGHAHATFDTLGIQLADSAAQNITKAKSTKQNKAFWQSALQKPLQLRWSNGTLAIAAASAKLTAPNTTETVQLNWQDSRWTPSAAQGWGSIQTTGALSGLPMRWVEFVQPGLLAQSGIDTDLKFNGDWNIQTEPSLQIRANLKRQSGDVHLQFADEDLAHSSTDRNYRTLADIQTAEFNIFNQGSDFKAQASWDSKNAGKVQLNVLSRLAQAAGGWSWPADTAISGTLKAQLPQVGIWSGFAPVGWRVDGSLDAQANIGGTRGAPTLQGNFSSDNIHIYSVIDGLDLEKGKLTGRFNQQQMVLESLSFTSPNGGTLTANGKTDWSGDGMALQFKAQADHLRISNRPDRRMELSGTLNAAGDEKKLLLKGKVAVDQAQIILPDETAPSLDDDVIVINTGDKADTAKSKAQTKAERNKQLQAKRDQKATRRQAKLSQSSGSKLLVTLHTDIQLALGDSFRLQGLGIDTFLRGDLHITSAGDLPAVNGTINTHLGEFRAYGQWLDIEKGEIRFSGMYDNPTLNITALRPRTEVDVGVRVTGPAFNPKIRLISTPDMPDANKLSWLILGREGAEGGAESAMLQQAALSLLGSGGTGTSLAQRVGLDEIGINRENNQTSSVSFGKRLSRKLYLSYEKNLLDSLGTLYMFYDISRRFKLRAQTGKDQAVDVIFTLHYNDIPDAVEQLSGKKSKTP